MKGFNFLLILFLITSCGDPSAGKRGLISSGGSDSTDANGTPAKYESLCSILVLPKNPVPGEPFRILTTGGENIGEAQVIVTGPSGRLKSMKSKTGDELPYWRIDDFAGGQAGKYDVTFMEDKKVAGNLEFIISPVESPAPVGVVWKTGRGWDRSMEAIYSSWINSLFQDCQEQSSWSSLHEVTQDPEHNFLYNYLSLGEDNPEGKIKVVMRPDCADNPFFLRAYFAWKMGLPFGYHVCNRGSLGQSPKTGEWITNETSSSNTNPVLAFNAFLRKVMDGVHSGTARTALDNENSDYYPVSLERGDLLPGTVYADPYGHTLILVNWIPQTNNRPGLLLAVDAQPDGTIAIKRFWKGNFLFNTSEVIGEPGFKVFRPIKINKGLSGLIQNKDLVASKGFVPFSLQQRNMNADLFYRTMERLINPRALDPETELLDLIKALHEQLLVRVTSVANGEEYFSKYPGTVIPMPGSAAGIFQAGGQWENFSTPNRDLRLLIAMDAVLNFPDLVAGSPENFSMAKTASPERIKEKLKSLLEQKSSELSINYTRSDGSLQNLSIAEILNRRDAFEIAYNPNDGIEIRWGAPENSSERSSCRRKAPSNQVEIMESVRPWFRKRLHPPT